MNNINGASFIPKKENLTVQKVSGKPVDFVFLIISVIFVATLVSAGGVFFYKNYLKKSIDESKIMLERERSNFDEESIRTIARLDKRINVAEDLLNGHIDMTKVFSFIEKNTIQSIQFKDLNLALTSDKVEISMEGVANSYASVALQSDEFGKNNQIKDLIFSDLDVNEKGDIVFNVDLSIDKSFVLFKNNYE